MQEKKCCPVDIKIKEGVRHGAPLLAKLVRRRRALPPKADQGKLGGERVSIITRSRIRDASAASPGLKLRMSNETIRLSPTQLQGGKKYSLSYVVPVGVGEFAPSPALEIPRLCEA
jgi:hypothetical protein